MQCGAGVAMTREALRQQMLLRALAGQPGAGLALQGWTQSRSERFSVSLNAYRANAAALAERALGAAYPTMAQLMGEPSFAAMARDFWRHAPPERGDVGEWGAGLDRFIADQASLAEEPYLADVARLEWAVHQASRARDATPDPLVLDRLRTHDAAQLRLQLAPGSALIASPWPLASIWQAHQRPADDPQRFDAVRAAFAAQVQEHAFVVREGWAVRVHALDPGTARFTQSLLSADSLAAALDAAGEAFAFDQWLVRALSSRWLDDA
jgi:Putative DNA-binding domain